ncbi:MAG: hypothetical protein ABI461_04530, partial [Polyangiaceae bacterium]
MRSSFRSRLRPFFPVVAHQRLAALVLAGVATAVMGGCGGSGSSANSPSHPLSALTKHDADLFDDAIEPKAVGLDYDAAVDPRIDSKFRERAQLADGIVRSRLETVTVRGDGATARYDMAFRAVEKLAGDAPKDEFTLHIEGDNPSSAIVRSMQTTLGGKTFVVFMREFARADGEPEWHFHISPDTKEVASAARDATTLAQMN